MAPNLRLGLPDKEMARRRWQAYNGTGPKYDRSVFDYVWARAPQPWEHESEAE